MRVIGKNQMRVIEKNRQMTKAPDVLTKTKVKRVSKISCRSIWPRLKNAEGREENNSRKIQFKLYFSCIINRFKRNM